VTKIVWAAAWEAGQGAVFQIDNVRFVGGGSDSDPGSGSGDSGGGDDGDTTLEAGDYIDFNDALEQQEITFTDFGGTFTDFIQDPTDANGTVASTTKDADAAEWAGTTIDVGPVIFPLTETATTMTVRVYSPAPNMVVRLKLEESGDDTHTVETDAVTTVADEWETLTFDFSNEAEGTAELDTSYVFDKLSIFFNKGVTGEVAGEVIFYWDSLTWVGAATAPSSNLVIDGTFDEATSTTWTGNAYNPVGGVNEADVAVAGNPWDVNLSGTVNITAGADYTLSFDVSGADRTIIAGIGQSAAPFMGHTDTITLSATTQTIVMHLTAKLDGVGDNFGDATSRVIFDMGADAGAVKLDNVSLTPGHTGTVNLGGAGDTSNLVIDGTFDEATSTTWTGNAYNPVGGVNEADVAVAGNPWDVNLSGTVNITAGADYTLSFDVSGADRTIIAGIGQSAAPFMGHTDTITLSATTQTIVMHLTAKLDGVGDNFGDATSRVIFDMGADAGAVKLDNVSLTPGHTGTVFP
ncbi:hypothetical protein OAP24_01030, partial [Porticoccaceae bacterium]|nr:hypothetical protein [Porticoccaceae bacterium]